MPMASADVLPIAPGYEATLHLTLDAAFFDLFCRGPRLVAQLRSTFGDALLQADTDAGTILRAHPNTLTILLSADVTRRMESLPVITFDFVSIEDGAQTEIPGLFTWPVARTVTRDVQ